MAVPFQLRLVSSAQEWLARSRCRETKRLALRCRARSCLPQFLGSRFGRVTNWAQLFVQITQQAQHLRALDVSAQCIVDKRAEVTIAGKPVSHCVNVGIERDGTPDRIAPTRDRGFALQCGVS